MNLQEKLSFFAISLSFFAFIRTKSRNFAYGVCAFQAYFLLQGNAKGNIKYICWAARAALASHRHDPSGRSAHLDGMCVCGWGGVAWHEDKRSSSFHLVHPIS